MFRVIHTPLAYIRVMIAAARFERVLYLKGSSPLRFLGERHRGTVSQTAAAPTYASNDCHPLGILDEVEMIPVIFSALFWCRK